MIQPQELRIGNYVSDLDGNILEILLISSKEVLTKRDSIKRIGGIFLIESINPIPLTEEILLKFGFNEVEGERWCDMHEEFEECNYYYLSMFKIYYNPETDKFEDDSLYHFNVNLKYVHQLQNLYFALTGKELTF